LLENYQEDKFIKQFFDKLILSAFEKGKYKQVLNLLKEFSEKYKEDCNINSWYIIAMLRTNPKDLQSVETIKQCSNLWSKIAKEIYEDYKLTEGVK
jgi:aromatic ring-opening dioxygenase LigB subunit